MTSIVQIGMDVHKNNFTVCCFDIGNLSVKTVIVFGIFLPLLLLTFSLLNPEKQILCLSLI